MGMEVVSFLESPREIRAHLEKEDPGAQKWTKMKKMEEKHEKREKKHVEMVRIYKEHCL